MPTGLVEDYLALLAAGVRALIDEGDLLASREHFDATYRAAARVNDYETMGAAALGSSGIWVHEHRDAAGAAMLQARLTKSLSLIDPGSDLGVRLRTRLAGETDYRNGESAKVLAVLDEARRNPEPEALADALSIAHHCLLGPGQGVVRRELAAELLEQSNHTTRRSDLLMGMLWQTVDQFLDADMRAERGLRDLRGLLAQDDHLAVGFVADAMDVMLAIRAGDLARAESLAQSCAQRGMLAGDADAMGWHAAQLVTVRWYQGRIAELLPMLQEVVHSPTLSAIDNSMFAALAVAAATAGESRIATGAIAKLSGRDLAELPRSSTWMVMLNGVVEAAHILRDADTSARAYELLSPYADLPMMASLGVSCFGSAHHALGIASLTTGDADKAVEHFQAAVQQNLALAHWPAVVASRLRHAQALHKRGLPSDLDIAQQEIASAAAEASAMGIPLREPGIDELTHRNITCTRLGRSWKIASGDRAIVLEHSIGLLHLAVLLANPGQEIYAVDLVSGLSVLSKAGADMAASSQPVLDSEAVQSYRDRLSILASEIATLEANNDHSGASVALAEREWILGELAAAAGITGATRRFPDGHERARIAVGKAIRRALTRITEADPTLGDYLRRSIHTGIRCCYRPF
jgi:hypothetical protein